MARGTELLLLGLAVVVGSVEVQREREHGKTHFNLQENRRRGVWSSFRKLRTLPLCALTYGGKGSLALVKLVGSKGEVSKQSGV